MNRQAKTLIAILAATCAVLGALLLLRSGGVLAGDQDGAAVAGTSADSPGAITGDGSSSTRPQTEPARPAGESRQRQRSWYQRLTGPRMVTVMLPAGLPLAVRLEQPIDSSEMRSGDTLAVSLAADLAAGGRLVAPAGSAGTARIIDRDKSGRVKGREKLALELVELTLAGEPRPIQTEALTLVAHDSHKRDAAIVGGAAAAGALIGALTGGGDGAAKGAAIGGVGGTGVVLATPGEDIDLPVGHTLRFTLERDVAVEVEATRETERRPSADVSRR